MKRVVSLGIVVGWVFLASLSEAAAGDRVGRAVPATSCNMVGFVNTATNSYVFTGCCYESVWGGPLSLKELLGDQLEAGSKGDKVAIWDAERQCYTMYMKDRDGRFRSTNFGTQAPVDPLVPAGTALWIIRKNPDSLISLTGSCPARAAITNSLVGATNHPLNMICYPYPVDVSVQDFINTTHGAQASDDPAKADKLTLWDARGVPDVRLGLKGDGKWHNLKGWAANAPSTRVIKVGEGVGFWASRPITWVVHRPGCF